MTNYTVNVIMNGDLYMKALYQSYLDLVLYDKDIEFKFDTQDSSMLTYKPKLFDFNISSNNGRFDIKNFDTFIVFDGFEHSVDFYDVANKKKLFLIEHMLFDADMNHVTSVIMPNEKFNILSQKAIYVVKEYFDNVSSLVKYHVVDSSMAGIRLLSSFNANYIVKRYFGIENMVSCFVSEEQSLVAYINMVNLVFKKYRKTCKNINKIKQIICDSSYYSDDEAMFNTLQKKCM